MPGETAKVHDAILAEAGREQLTGAAAQITAEAQPAPAANCAHHSEGSEPLVNQTPLITDHELHHLHLTEGTTSISAVVHPGGEAKYLPAYVPLLHTADIHSSQTAPGSLDKMASPAHIHHAETPC